MEKEEPKPRKDKRVFTLFIVIIFSLLLAMTRQISDDIIAVVFQVILIFAQIVIVKSLIDSYMGESD